jgi:hypothetical protein
MDRISALHTGDSDKPKQAANDSENMFKGSPHLTTDGSNNHILDLFRGGRQEHPANDNVPEAVAVNLEPLVESIDRNTAMMVEQLKEINNKLQEMILDETSEDFNDKEAKVESAYKAKAEQLNSPASYGRYANSNKIEAEKPSLLKGLGGALGGILGGGVLGALGDAIADPSPNHIRDDGDYGGIGNQDRRPNGRRQREFKVDPDPVTGNFTERQKMFLKVISSSEGAGYDTVFGNGKYGSPNKKLTDMTINEVTTFQRKLQANTKAAGHGVLNGKVVGTSAVGKGQFVRGTLLETLGSLGHKPKDFDTLKYTAELQNQLILQLAKNKGIDPNRPETLRNQRRVGSQWESLASHKINNGEFNRRIDMVERAPSQALANNVRTDRVGQGANVSKNSAQMAAKVTQNITVIQQGGQTVAAPQQQAQTNTTRNRPPSAKSPREQTWMEYFGFG